MPLAAFRVLNPKSSLLAPSSGFQKQQYSQGLPVHLYKAPYAVTLSTADQMDNHAKKEETTFPQLDNQALIPHGKTERGFNIFLQIRRK